LRSDLEILKRENRNWRSEIRKSKRETREKEIPRFARDDN
jgi:hypothetical protein